MDLWVTHYCAHMHKVACYVQTPAHSHRLWGCKFPGLRRNVRMEEQPHGLQQNTRKDNEDGNVGGQWRGREVELVPFLYVHTVFCHAAHVKQVMVGQMCYMPTYFKLGYQLVTWLLCVRVWSVLWHVFRRRGDVRSVYICVCVVHVFSFLYFSMEMDTNSAAGSAAGLGFTVELVICQVNLSSILPDSLAVLPLSPVFFHLNMKQEKVVE